MRRARIVERSGPRAGNRAVQIMILVAGGPAVANNRGPTARCDVPTTAEADSARAGPMEVDPTRMSTDDATLAAPGGPVRGRRDRLPADPVRGHPRRGQGEARAGAALRDVVEAGAGFAGGAVWGMGQGPHSHDMWPAPIPRRYTPLPYEPGRRPVRGRPVRRRPAPSLLPPREPEADPRPRRERGYRLQRRHRARVLPGDRRTPTARSPAGTRTRVDDLAKPCYDFKGMSAALEFLRR